MIRLSNKICCLLVLKHDLWGSAEIIKTGINANVTNLASYALLVYLTVTFNVFNNSETDFVDNSQ